MLMFHFIIRNKSEIVIIYNNYDTELGLAWLCPGLDKLIGLSRSGQDMRAMVRSYRQQRVWWCGSVLGWCWSDTRTPRRRRRPRPWWPAATPPQPGPAAPASGGPEHNNIDNIFFHFKIFSYKNLPFIPSFISIYPLTFYIFVQLFWSQKYSIWFFLRLAQRKGNRKAARFVLLAPRLQWGKVKQKEVSN